MFAIPAQGEIHSLKHLINGCKLTARLMREPPLPLPLIGFLGKLVTYICREYEEHLQSSCSVEELGSTKEEIIEKKKARENARLLLYLLSVLAMCF